MFQINFKSTKNISSNTIKFIFEQAEKRLKSTLDMSDRITIRSYSLVAILIPSFDALFSILNSSSNCYFQYQIVLIVLSVISLSLVILFIVLILFPRDMHQLGSEPKTIGLPEFYENPDYPLEESYILILSNVIEEYQIRIEYMEVQNAKRINLLKYSYYILLFLYSLILIYFTTKNLS